MPTAPHRLTPSTEAALFARCVELLFVHAKTAILTALAVAVIFVGLMWKIFPHGWLLSWLSAMAVVSLARLWHIFAFFRVKPPAADAGHWLIQFVAGSALAATLWGVTGVVFMPENHPLHQVFTLITLIGLSGAAVTAYSSVLWAYRVFLWVLLSPVAVMMLWRGDVDHVAIGAVVFFYTFMMSRRAAVMVNNTIVESISHSLRIAELLQLNESIINHTDSGVAAYSTDGECVFMNAAAHRILGIPVGLDVRHNFRNTPSWKEYGLVEIADKVLQGGEQKSIELPMHTIYGWSVWIAAKLHRIMQGDQPILLVVFSEISPQRNTAHAAQPEAKETHPS